MSKGADMFETFYFEYNVNISDENRKLFESHVKTYAPEKRANMQDYYSIGAYQYRCKKAYGTEYIEVTLMEIVADD